MRIVHYLNRVCLNDGGVVRAVLDLCPALAAAGHEVTLLTCDDTDVPEEWRRATPWSGVGSVASVRLSMSALPGGRLGRAAIDAAREVLCGADVAHVHAMWIPSNDQIARVCRREGVPYILSPHGMLDDWCMAQKALKKRIYYAFFARRALKGAAAVHCTAEAELTQASKWFGSARGVVVPLPFELADYRDLPGPELARAKLGIKRDRPTILFLSRLHPKKGVGILIEAVSALNRRGVAANLLIAGGGDESYVRSLKDLAARPEAGDQVRFVGFVKGREKVSLYQAADIFVLPSSQENFGYAVVEAMAAGTAVITTRGVALWPQLERASAAVLVEPKVDALERAIEGLLKDPAERARLGRAGREWCLREMDPRRIIEGFSRMYTDAAGTSGRVKQGEGKAGDGRGGT